MPEIWRAFHSVAGTHLYEGRARVICGQGALAWIVAGIFRFPPASDDTLVRVELRRAGQSEHWTRHFGASRFASVLRPAQPGYFRERFGAFEFLVRLTGDETYLGMEVERGWFLGLPVPRFLCPHSHVREEVRDGRFQFDVEIAHPACGRIVRYQGWLAPVQAQG
ncbi:MAG: DUF4166 domain-containing protein [Pseudomonadota bacterium]